MKGGGHRGVARHVAGEIGTKKYIEKRKKKETHTHTHIERERERERERGKRDDHR